MKILKQAQNDVLAKYFEPSPTESHPEFISWPSKNPILKMKILKPVQNDVEKKTIPIKPMPSPIALQTSQRISLSIF